MYFVALEKQYGYDSLFHMPDSTYKAGDILQDPENTYMCLGKDVAFQHLYLKIPTIFLKNTTIIAKNFLSDKTIDIIHRMVKEYYSSYKHVVGLFIPIHDFTSAKTQNAIANSSRVMQKKRKKDGDNQSNISHQTCIMFPDLRSLYNISKEKNIISAKTHIIHGGMTQTHKQKVFFLIKTGEIETILTTNRGLFFDWYNLKEVIIYDSNNWAYSSQNEPRFTIKETVTYITEKHNASLSYII